MEFDLLIVGASFAGLAAARTAASRGLKVAVIEAKREPGARIHTSGILVKEAVEEIDLPHHLTRRVPGVRLYAPSLKSVDLFSPGYAFFTTAHRRSPALDGPAGEGCRRHDPLRHALRGRPSRRVADPP